MTINVGMGKEFKTETWRSVNTDKDAQAVHAKIHACISVEYKTRNQKSPEKHEQKEK